jgi:hypothetical protein
MYNSLNAQVDEGLDLDDSRYPFPKEAIAQITQGWNLQVQDLSGKEFWVQVVNKEPQGFLCQTMQQPIKQIFVRPQNIEAAIGGGDNLVQNGKGMTATRTMMRRSPDGQMQSTQTYSVYADIE